MLRWLTKKLAQRRRAAELASRNLFHSHDGTQDRYVDPLRAFRALRDHQKLNCDTHLPHVPRGMNDTVAPAIGSPS
jgi:hypothetical protein